MKTRLFSVVTSALLLAAFAAPAQAMYHAGMGRFMQRDPANRDITRVPGRGTIRTSAFVARDQYPDGMTLYEYVRSAPTTRRDPFGLQATQPASGSRVAIECAPVRRYGVTLGYHCSIVSSCPGMPTTRYEDRGPADSDKKHEDRKKKSPDNGEGAMPDDYLDEEPWGEWRRYKVTCPDERSDCDTCKCIKDAFDAAKFHPYDAFGPNSNTFAHALLNKCGCEVSEYLGRCYEYRMVQWPGEFIPHSELVEYPCDTRVPYDAVGWRHKSVPAYW